MNHPTEPMDVDEMDIDLGTDADVQALEAESMIPEDNGAQEGTNGPSTWNGLDSGFEVQQEKVHIRGLDHFGTEDVSRFASEHFPLESARIEWVDDTSANIHFTSAELAAEALKAFQDPTFTTTSDPLTLRKAKPLSTHPQVELHVRIALATDIKQKRAHEASRYYLLNPDQDPRERRRGTADRRGGGRNYDDRRNGKRNNDEDDAAPFDVNLYDDDPDSLAARIQPAGAERGSYPRQSSLSPRQNGSRRRRRSGSEEELLPSRNGKNSDGRLRDRSASPTIGGDGRLGFEESEESRMRRVRRRSFTPPSGRMGRSGNPGRELLGAIRVNAGKELLGERTKTVRRDLMERGNTNIKGVLAQNDAPELFPNSAATILNGSSTELFPSKAPSSNHRRKAAFDAADGTGDLFSSRMTTPLRNNAEDFRAGESSLAGRINSGTSQGLASRISTPTSINTNSGFHIRGTAGQETNPGFSIRGAAGVNNPRVKELFPERGAVNEGKELFSRVSGRGRPRKTAEDMFT